MEHTCRCGMHFTHRCTHYANKSDNMQDSYSGKDIWEVPWEKTEKKVHEGSS